MYINSDNITHIFVDISVSNNSLSHPKKIELFYYFFKTMFNLMLFSYNTFWRIGIALSVRKQMGKLR